MKVPADRRHLNLGHVQREVLEALERSGSWHCTCGWVWDTPGRTQRVLDQLVKRRLARTAAVGNGKLIYYPTKLTSSKLLEKLHNI